ncbi:hypothetical protein [Thalassospira alkalitolerans]|uniref:hypothetical protein n=1 Tax=Thalassospira alkalitolerans TaxID=1293890 RepID=UPI003AA93474
MNPIKMIVVMALCVGAAYFLDDLDIKWKLASVAAMVAALYAHFETKIEDIKMDISILYDRMNEKDR